MTVKHALSAEAIRMSGRIAFKAREQILALMRDWIGSEQTSWGLTSFGETAKLLVRTMLST
jgi:hypothetical protein